MEYSGLQSYTDHPYLGGNILEGDPFTFAPRSWQYLMDRFAINSVLDLGSGLGYSAAFFHKAGAKVIAVDGLLKNVEKAIYPTIQADLALAPVHCCVDLVHCQEVVEHIDENYLDNLLSSLSCGRFIVMTNALPGQEGHHHINEQQTSYWTGHMARYNCHLLVEDTYRLRLLAASEGANYLAATGSIYANRNKF
ncbi:bifunctional 2-polyprenyl-6-hydroxyphenol methylase/3-demethylubiquinol 3-O-methyltransferase UbiG [Dyadobacter sp. CY347]|uniref:class I SAM-dependent methyltransferase n=1 Tax=Dyadobacter sp. CY347 TaxID=2909336 RepID=UPI001F30F47F|nr:class I SAM-dependent methyltransferase [Dyadobacter sp. CY347]MCF2487526.1 class I SAM-dependent methyltransferase [Dyadobacter sp. CY347]